MDINAGAVLEGAPVDEVGAEIFEQILAVASGKRTKSELAASARRSSTPGSSARCSDAIVAIGDWRTHHLPPVDRVHSEGRAALARAMEVATVAAAAAALVAWANELEAVEIVVATEVSERFPQVIASLESAEWLRSRQDRLRVCAIRRSASDWAISRWPKRDRS